ncbi:MAG TPA: GNAT family N-acetyltransferase [Clostridia bacterium]|nr:GNAT family N-acetyltransferase [Clostridia bacterium]
MDVIIKKATYDDISVIYEITMDAFQKYASDLGLPDQVHALKETYESIREDLEKKTVLVAWINDNAVGTIRCEPLSAGNSGYISRFGVKTGAHNCGVGKALISAIEVEAQKQGMDMLSLHTASKMFSLVRFYYGMGYYIHSTTTDRGYIRAYFCKELEKVNSVCRAL